MEVGKRRGTTTTAAAAARNGVVSGSIWESRMKIDQVKGGIKVFNGDDDDNDDDQISDINNNININKKKKLKPKLTLATTPIGKRKTWKSENSSPNPIQIARNKLLEDSLQQLKETTDDDDGGIHKFSLIQTPQLRKTRSELGKEMILSLVVDDDIGNEKTPIRRIKSRFEESTKEVNSPVNKIPIQIRKEIGGSGEEERIEKNPMPSGSIDENNEKNPSNSSRSSLDIEQKKPKPEKIITIDGTVDQSDIIEIESAPIKLMLDEKKDEIIEEKEIIIGVGVEEKSKQVVNEVKKKKMMMTKQIQERTVPIVKKQIPSSSKPKFNRVSQRHSRLQSLVDLVMWIDVSKSAFVFGFGTFIIISSSYTNDVNISLISVVSYLGLVYLAVIFLSRSIIRRGNEVADNGNIDNDDVDELNEKYYVIGEEEAMWLMRKILPYLNEFLLKLRALFSGDPSTTMKLAVMLYILARCGSSITIWKMIKFGFIGIFTVPKICSSYSTQFTAYGNFWFRRFLDAWVSCSHKKAVAVGIFTLIWNLSSVVARCWALFMLFVAFRYYKESSLMMNRDVGEEDDVQRREDTCQTPIGKSSGRRVRSTLLHTTTTSTVSMKEKKRY
ncbi:reticulon-like protein B21 [Impatiens glandulifera]|uniref:reticulon-like protein B21 n=1 Tax=Impatiens glandulifera TaxID=253017 RepID=UPI001FB15379|nr:reticulon-like protein B21 [Impatiens glandulifera]